MNKLLILLGLTLCVFKTTAQDDNVVIEEDSLTVVDSTYYLDEEYVEEEDKDAPADSAKVTARFFDETTLDRLKSDESLLYKEPPTIAESLWDRFMMWLMQSIDSLFRSAVDTNWGQVFLYLLGLAVIVVIVMMILKVDAFKVFYRAQGANTIPHTVFEENIHEIDFETEIQNAVSRNDYRRGVRLVFLYALKLLSDKQLIDWEQGKTNHEYVNELKTKDLKQGLNELSFYFDYAWYGNFSVNQELFSKVQGIFNDWKRKV